MDFYVRPSKGKILKKKKLLVWLCFFFSCLDYILIIKCALMCFCSCRALLKHLTTYCALGVEHKFCVRHLHANCKGKGWKGKAFKDELWGTI
jgi:hypothetical protein